MFLGERKGQVRDPRERATGKVTHWPVLHKWTAAKVKALQVPHASTEPLSFLCKAGVPKLGVKAEEVVQAESRVGPSAFRLQRGQVPELCPGASARHHDKFSKSIF